jgi:regulator of cell morphogenesis and NO signaling
MKAEPGMSLQEIAAEVPGAIRVLESYGLDYCQSDRHPLITICAERGLGIESLLMQIGTAELTADQIRAYEGWSDKSLSDLISIIRIRHHSFTSGQLAHMAELFEEAAATKSRYRHDWKRVQRAFNAFRLKLEQHMNFEEQVVFPYIEAIEAAARGGGPYPTAFFPTIQRPVRMMLLDHEAADELLRRLREALANSSLERSRSRSLREFSAVMEPLKNDLSTHIFLETYVLFPRAVNLESLTLEPLRLARED